MIEGHYIYSTVFLAKHIDKVYEAYSGSILVGGLINPIVEFSGFEPAFEQLSEIPKNV